MQLNEPVECASGGDPLFLYKILHLLFFSTATNSLYNARWESKKKVFNMVLMWDLRNFSFLGREDVSPTHSEHCRLVSGS